MNLVCVLVRGSSPVYGIRRKDHDEHDGEGWMANALELNLFVCHRSGRGSALGAQRATLGRQVDSCRAVKGDSCCGQGHFGHAARPTCTMPKRSPPRHVRTKESITQTWHRSKWLIEKVVQISVRRLTMSRHKICKKWISPGNRRH